jgi:hypothetical protein
MGFKLVTEAKPVRFVKALLGICVTLLPIMSVEREGQLLKTELPIVVFIALKYTVLRAKQPENALFPIDITPLPIVTEVKKRFAKALFGI